MSSFLSIIFSYSVQQQQSSLDRIVMCNKKWILYDNRQPPAEWLDYKKLQSTFQSWTCTKKSDGHCWSATNLIHELFLNPNKTITSKKYVQQIFEVHQKLQCLQPSLDNRKGPIILWDNAWLHVAQPILQSLTNCVTKFCLICHIQLISCQITTTSSTISTTFCRENTSTTSMMQQMLSKCSLNPEAWTFMLQE